MGGGTFGGMAYTQLKRELLLLDTFLSHELNDVCCRHMISGDDLSSVCVCVCVVYP